MNTPRITLIAALSRETRAIGFQNQLLWDMPDDMSHFRSLTIGHAIIMGERTYRSIGRALPKRVNVVLTDNPVFTSEEVLVARNIDEALRIARAHEEEEVFVIGGGSIYTQFLERADRLYLTLVEGEFEADTFFPEYRELFEEKEITGSGESGGYPYQFVTFERKI
jgi:dihydrofolate reductase